MLKSIKRRLLKKFINMSSVTEIKETNLKSKR